MKARTWLLLITAFIIASATGQEVPRYEKKMKADSMRRQSGYSNYTQFGIGARLNHPVFAFSTVNGYQFSKHIFLGAGIGYSHVSYPLWNERYFWSLKNYKSKTTVAFDQLNVFIEPRFFPGRSAALFLFIDVGYSLFLSANTHELTWDEQSDYLRNFPDPRYDTLVKTRHTGSLYLAPGSGGKFFIDKDITLNFSLQLFIAACNRQETKLQYGDLRSTEALKINLYPLFAIGLGF